MSDLRRTFKQLSAPDSHSSDPHREVYDPIRRPFMLSVANILSSATLPGLDLPRFAAAGSQQTYAPWPVWKDSTTKAVKFMPLAKKQATKFFHKARSFERQTRQKGRQDGAIIVTSFPDSLANTGQDWSIIDPDGHG
jgi:hypothetical protein